MAYIIAKHCSTCHYCFNECPVHAIRFVGREYAIDQGKCIKCGKCEKVCPAGVIINTEEPKPVPHNRITLECDAVIIGGGGAGLIAAARFAEITGKKTIVLEKSRKTGGNTTLGHNFILRNSKAHRAAGCKDHRDEHVERLYKASGETLDYELLKKATYAVSDAFDWMYDNSDLRDHVKLKKFEDEDQGFQDFMGWGSEAYFDFPERTQNKKSTDHSMGPGWMGTFVVDFALKRCKEAGVKVLTEHAAKKILVDESGVFQAVLVQDPGGETLVKAKCCLLASGGFACGKEVMDRVLPSFNEEVPAHTFTMASNTGDAIGMVEEIGGAIDLEHVKVPLFGPTHHPFHFSNVRMAGDPGCVQINLNGVRYTNEASRDTIQRYGPLEEQPKKSGFAVLDSILAESIGEGMVKQSANNPGMLACMKPWKEQLEEECELFDIAAHKAETLEDLADKMGVDRNTFVAQIRKYNEDCRQGVDTQFGKPAMFMKPIENPPYYALYLSRFNEGAEGGVLNDSHLRVLKADKTPFIGLYTAGDTCRGLLKEDDHGGKFGEMGWAVASGYLAGQEMADFIN